MSTEVEPESAPGPSAEPSSSNLSAASASSSGGARASSSSGTTKGKTAINAVQIERRRQKRKYAIKKLEKKMEQYHRQIKKFNEEEVSMDEMLSGKSAYLMEDYLKRKFIACWEELCQIMRIPSTIEISHEDGLDANYSGTSYPEINRRVMRLLRNDEFPDYMDICELIDRCNTKHDLGISSAEKTEMARKVFKDVGQTIKARRIKDYRAHFGSHLTDSAGTSVDPATKDDELLETLRKSLDEGKEKMKQLVEDYVVKQEEGGGKESSHEDSEEGEEGEEEEEEEEEEEGISAEEMEAELRSSQIAAVEKDEEKDESSGQEEDDEDLAQPASKKVRFENGSTSESVDPHITTTTTTTTTADPRDSSSSPDNSSSNSSVGSIDVGTVDDNHVSSSTKQESNDVVTLSDSDSDDDVVVIDDSD